MNTSRIEANLQDLQRALGLYVQASGKSVEEVFAKKSSQLGYQLRLEFRTLMPGKGSVRNERLEALKTGEGVRVRPSVYAAVAEKFGAAPLASSVMKWRSKGGQLVGTNRKGLNLQALAVQAEFNLRESGRGLLGQSAGFIGWRAGNDVSGTSQAKADSRYGAWLAKAGVTKTGTGTEAKFEWGGLSSMSDEAVHGIARTQGLAAVARAIDAVTSDMVPYLASHLDMTAEQMGLRA